MKNIIDYAKEEQQTFLEKELNQVDSLVFSQLAYINYEVLISPEKRDITMYELLKPEHFQKMVNGIVDEEKTKDFIVAVGMSRRFREIRLVSYTKFQDEKEEKQFAAITFLLPNNRMYVAFRGTDGSVLGWKEDFNMAFMKETPSQAEGVSYLHMVADEYPCDIYIGGHSKGGNLAIYAASKMINELDNRILKVFSHDGPGFQNDFFASAEIEKLHNRIFKTVPTQSVVGMMLEGYEKYQVVTSAGVGVWQHNPYNWKVQGGDFEYRKRIAKSSVVFCDNLNKWLKEMTKEEREKFVNSLYYVCKTCNIISFSGEERVDIKELPSILKSMENVDNTTKKVISETIFELIKISIPFK